MTWTKLSDDYSDDCWTLSDAAFRLHTEALIWSNRKLLDCRIPKGDLPRFSPSSSKAAQAAADELVEKEFWSSYPDHYVINHHARYQPSREDVVKRQRTNRENGKKGGQSTKAKGRGKARVTPLPPTDSVSDSVSESLSESLSESATHRDGTGRAVTGASEVDENEPRTVEAVMALLDPEHQTDEVRARVGNRLGDRRETVKSVAENTRGWWQSGNKRHLQGVAS